MPVEPVNEELAAKLGLTAIEQISALREENKGLRDKLALLETEVRPKPPSALIFPPRRRPRIRVIEIFLIALILAGGAGLLLRYHRASTAASALLQTAPAAPILTLTGSNTLGDQLVPHLVEAFLQSQHLEGVERVRQSEPVRFEVRGRLPGSAGVIAIQINASGSENGFRDLVDGKCDIGMSSRRITASEAGQLSRLGNMTSPACEHVIGLDGVAFIVNRKNPLKSLTTDQLVDLLTCRVRTWARLGGAPAPVKLIRRNDESGTYKTVRDLLLGGGEICADAEVIADSQELSRHVALDANAIGFVGLPYVGANRALALGDGVTPALGPDPITVGTEEYSLARRLYLYTADHSANEWVRKLLDFASSEQGQALVMRDGFVGQNVIALPPSPARAEAPPAYVELTAGAERLSLDFRFESASSDLDNKAPADLRRVAAFMQDPAREGRRLFLFGFADSTGIRSTNCRLAQTRAEGLAKKLHELAVPAVVALGFCDDLPVASNRTPEGRNRSRRVEVWVK